MPALAKRLLALAALLAVAVAAVASYRATIAAAAAAEAEEAFAAARLKAVGNPRSAPAPVTDAGLPDPVRALGLRPLDAAPLLRAGLVAANPGSREELRGRRLIGEALRRDPRSRSARTWLLVNALLRNRTDEALAQVDRLLALSPGQADAYFPMLAALLGEPRARPRVAAMLADKPAWRTPFLSYLNARRIDPTIVFYLTGAGAGAVQAEDREQAALVATLIEQGDYERAYLSWINFLPESALAQVQPVYDGGFKGLPGPQPFNWKLAAGDVANVAIEPGTGMVIDYNGDAAAVLAEQMLVLDPQGYAVRYTAAGDAATEGGKQVMLRFYCLPQRTLIHETPLEVRPDVRTAFVVPPVGCPAQLLTIEGAPGEFPGQRQLTLRAIDVAPAR